MASLKKRKLRKSLLIRSKAIAKVESDKAWRRIWIRKGVLNG